MKILLLDPPIIRDKANLDDVVNTPLASCLITGYIGAYLEEKGFEVTVISYPGKREAHALIDSSIFRFFDIIGIHLVYQWDNTGKVLELAKCIKEANGDSHVAVYGYYPTFTYEDILKKNPFIDSVIVGEPEEPFARLVSCIVAGDQGKNGVLPKIAGVAYRSTSGIEFQPLSPIDNIDALPFPLRDNVETEEEVFYILGSRGCFGRCSFCYIPEYHGRGSRWRGRSPENIVDEMKYLKENFGARHFYFADANFFGPGLEGKKRVERFAEILEKERLKVRFGFECMPSDVEEDTLRRLISVGLEDIFLGIESGSERILRTFRRMANKDRNREAIRIVRRLNINLSIGFIMWTPYSYVPDIRDNFIFLKELNFLSSPSNSAHLLSHREFLFKGVDDGRMDFAGRGENPLLYDYERTYRFEDPGVQMIYDAVYPACKLVLRLFNGEDLGCGACGVAGKSGPLADKVNHLLIGYFEEVLVAVENGEIDKNALEDRYKRFEQAIMDIKK